MGTPAENDDPLAAARELAKAHRLRIVDVHDRVVEADGLVRWAPAFVVYRAAPGEKGTRLGRRRDPAALLRFVRQLIGDTVPTH
jgi:hypothetical protein